MNNLFKVLVMPISYLYTGIVSLRNQFYQKGYFEQLKPSVFTLGVGNITMGGTGKTPLSMQLIQDFLVAGKKPAVVSRGYKGVFDGVKKVNVNDNVYYGDEPTLIADKFKTVPVYVGKDRVEVIKNLIHYEKNIDLVIADDVFQHRRLSCHKMILLIDALEEFYNYKVLPSGRGREPFTNVVRADYVIINKFNLINERKREDLFFKIKNEFIKVNKPIPLIATINYSINRFYNITNFNLVLDNTSHVWPILVSKKIALVSGLANAKSFELLVKEKDFAIKHHFHFQDHHNYSHNDFVNIEDECRKKEIEAIITTEKDAIKLKKYKWNIPIWVAVLDIQKGEGYEQVFKEILSSMG